MNQKKQTKNIHFCKVWESSQKFGTGKDILMFLKDVSYALVLLGCIYLIQNTVKTEIVLNIIKITVS